MHKFALKAHYTLFKNTMLVAFALLEKLLASQNIPGVNFEGQLQYMLRVCICIHHTSSIMFK